MGSILKVRGTELQQRMSELIVDALGDYGAIAYPEPHDPGLGEPMPDQQTGRGKANEMFFRRASTIYGGTSEVQRGIIAKMLFQL
jgi:acyl-CoA dehydrogenase